MIRVYIIILLTTVVCAQTEVDTSQLSLEQFIAHVAKKTNKTIIYDQSAQSKKVMVANLKAASNDDLLSVLFSLLEYNGYFVEKVGTGNNEVLKIKRGIQGPWTSTPLIYTKEELKAVGNTDKFITMVINLKYISAREVQTTLRALRIVNPQGGNIAGLEGSNSILITDFATNVQRVYSVIERMDRKQNVDIMSKPFPVENKVIPVKLMKGSNYQLSIRLSDNISVVVKDEEDNVIANGSGSYLQLWLNHHMQNSVSKKIRIELEILKEDRSKIEVYIKEGERSSKDNKTIWNFSAFHALAKSKKIKFALKFSME